ncbi:MAG: hypothetical protein VZQ61_06735 [Christensenellaceae bacterium]
MDNEKLIQQSPAVTFEEKGEDTGSFVAFMRFLRRFIVLIVICTVIGTAAGLGLALVRDKKVYTQSKSVIIIANITNKSISQSITATKNLSNSVLETIKSPIFISNANEKYGATDTDYLSSSAIGVSGKESMIFKISYSDYDANTAARKLDAYISAVKEEIRTGYLPASEIIVNDIDNVPKTSVSSGFVKYVLLGLFGGLVLGFALAFLIYLFDNTVSSKAELERLTGAAVVAYIDDVA